MSADTHVYPREINALCKGTSQSLTEVAASLHYYKRIVAVKRDLMQIAKNGSYTLINGLSILEL